MLKELALMVLSVFLVSFSVGVLSVSPVLAGWAWVIQSQCILFTLSWPSNSCLGLHCILISLATLQTIFSFFFSLLCHFTAIS